MKQNEIIKITSDVNTVGVGNALKINNILVDDTTRGNGKVIAYNSTTGNNEYMTVSVSGIVGSTGSLTSVGNMIDIAPSQELTFNHTTIADAGIIVNVQEQILGSSISDTHVNLSDSTKYVTQDNKGIAIENNKAQLDIYTKLLLHMDENTFKDECGRVVTNNNSVALDTTNKVFGNASAYFAGSSLKYFSVANYTDFNFLHQVGTTGMWTIDCYLKLPTTLANIVMPINTAGASSANSGIIISILTDYSMTVYIDRGSAGTFVVNYVSSANLFPKDDLFHHLEVSYDQSLSINNLKVFIDGTLVGTQTKTANAPSVGDCKTFGIGGTSEVPTYYFKGNIEEFRISKGIVRHTANFTPPSMAYKTPYITANKPMYFKTTGSSNFSLTTANTITSLTIPVTTPTNTTIKVLFSVDNGTNWLYKDGTGLHKYTGDLTVAWTSSNSNTDLQTYFAGLTVAQLTTNLSGLSITPIGLDFIFQLNTTDITVTPTVSALTLDYVANGYTQLASFGGYDEQYVKFGVKRISSSMLGVKNLTSTTKKINVNVVLSSV